MAGSPSPNLRIPQWSWYAGGGLALGGAFLLYKRRKASATAAPTMTQPNTNVDTSAQQPSIAPYYLSSSGGSPGQYGGNTLSGGAPPLPTPTTVTGSTNTTGPAGTDQDNGSGNVISPLPPIAPILPVNPTPGGPTTAAPPPPPPAPTPGPAAQNNNLPPDLLAKIQANGERIVSSLQAPNGGVWYLGSKGGVFAINAPFFGAPAGQSYWGSRQGLQIVPNGQGYTVIDTAGERYSYA